MIFLICFIHFTAQFYKPTTSSKISPTMANESLVIYSMNKVGRLVPSSNKLILRDISLGFYYGAT